MKCVGIYFCLKHFQIQITVYSDSNFWKGLMLQWVLKIRVIECIDLKWFTPKKKQYVL